MEQNIISTNPPETIANVPPRIIKRNQYGLIEDVNYVFDSNGFVDWRRLIKNEYLVPNSKKTEETDISKLQDSELIILLGGLRYLAHLRGFNRIHYFTMAASADYVSVICEIHWLANYETESSPVCSCGLGDAHERNTEGFARDYLAAMAENRAFARCVRNFLRINIVSDEEFKNLDGKAKEENPTNPLSLLSALMFEKQIDFDKIKKRLVKDGLLEAAEYKGIDEIPAPKMYEMIQLLKKSKKRKSKD